jgi:hypothetical protein
MKGWVGLIGGFVLGLLSAIIVTLVSPDLLTPYITGLVPADQTEFVNGMVVKKQRESDRLLLTLSTPEGVLLATFTEKIKELDLLISEGYATTIRLETYSPFVENPVIERVEINNRDQSSDMPSHSTP